MADLDVLEDRDPAFWRKVADHPEVQATGVMGGPGVIEALVADPRMTPLRSEHGGYLFSRLDPIGRVYEFHTLFTPEGWGREVNATFKASLKLMFSRGAFVVVGNEVVGTGHTSRPRSFGFKPAGPTTPFHGFNLRTWVLTREAWESSPAFLRAV